MFNTLPNLTTQSVQTCEPWTIVSPRPALANKDEFRAWCNNPLTQHAFVSAVTGAQPTLRVSEVNPPAHMSGLILDYDAVPSGPPEQMLLLNSPSDLRPAWVSRTFSGHCRVLFKFEETIPLFTLEVAREFLKKASRELKLRKLLPGFESEALLDLAKHYEIGDQWTPVGDGTSVIPTSQLMAWLAEASRKHKWDKEGVSIPVEVLRAEGEKKFPGKWPNGWSSFEIGSRGPRFWDDSSHDVTSTIVRDTGCQYFSDGGGWVTWEQIFGVDFVRRWAADRRGNAIKDIYFDGQRYWRKNAAGNWAAYSREDTRLKLMGGMRLSSKAAKVGSSSEIDDALLDIQELKLVSKAMPFVFRPDGPIKYNGKNYLNTSTIRPVLPVDIQVEWGEGFPWIAQFLYTLFDPDDQLDYFIAWLKHFYMGAYTQSPKRGLALFIAGPVGAGKTVLNKVILGQLFGGRQDAGKYLSGKDQFNEALFGAAVWNVDDEVQSDDIRQRAIFTQMVKKIVANDSFTYRAMYSGGEDMEWVGRPIITMNDDPESLQMLPETERNILDKIDLFKTKSPDVTWWPSDEQIAAELPYLAAYLRDWVPPAFTVPPVGKGRFGVVSYQHADLLRSAAAVSNTSSFEEVLQLWRIDWFAAGGPGADQAAWTGNPTALSQVMAMNPGLKSILERNFSNTTTIGIHLNKLLRRGVPYITRDGPRTYIIQRPAYSA